MAEFTKGHLGKLDAKTLKVTWFARRRRTRGCGGCGSTIRTLLMTLYCGNKIAVFDPKTRVHRIWVPPQTKPYRAQIDKNGEIWTGGMHTDRAVRLDPKSGKTVEYLLRRRQHAHRLHRQLDQAGDVRGPAAPRRRAGEGEPLE